MNVRLLITLLCLTPVACSEQSAPAPTAAPSAPAGSASTVEPPPEPAATGETRQRTVYVPAYSHLPRGAELNRQSLMAILLSVRNVDPTATITLTHVDYFDTSGHRVRRYLSAPRPLRPLETADFSVATQDDAGGSGANFLVYWEGPSDAHPLLAEAVMWARLGAGHLAFTSRGVELQRRPSSKLFDDSALQPVPSASAQ